MATTGSARYPVANYRFRVEIDGIQTAAFQEVTIANSSQDAIEYCEGTDTVIRKLPGRVKYSNITLKRGITDSLELFEWRTLVENGDTHKARRNISIILYDESAQFNEIARWVVYGSWPSKYESSNLNATGNEIAVETLELQLEKIERSK